MDDFNLIIINIVIYKKYNLEIIQYYLSLRIYFIVHLSIHIMTIIKLVDYKDKSIGTEFSVIIIFH